SCWGLNWRLEGDSGGTGILPVMLGRVVVRAPTWQGHETATAWNSQTAICKATGALRLETRNSNSKLKPHGAHLDTHPTCIRLDLGSGHSGRGRSPGRVIWV